MINATDTGGYPRLDVNATLSQVEKLQTQRSYRTATSLHYIEGVRNFVQAVETGADLITIIWSDKLLKVPIARKLVRVARRSGQPSVRVTPEQFRQISHTPRASGVGAIIRQHWSTLSSISSDKGLCWIALEQVRSAGNLGSLIRSSEAIGGCGFILLGDGVDPFDPTVVRSSMSALFKQTFIRTSQAELVRWIRRYRCRVVGASPNGANEFHHFSYYPRPIIIVLGEERRGLTDSQCKLCQAFVRIPINGQADSLNLAVAGSLLLYEVFRTQSDPFPPPSSCNSPT